MDKKQAELRAYQPSLSERLASAIAAPFEWAGADGRTAQEWGKKFGGLTETLVPPVGLVTAHDAASRQIERDPSLGSFATGAAGVALAGAGTAVRSPFQLTPGTPRTFKLPDGSTQHAEPIKGIVDAMHDYGAKRGMKIEMPSHMPRVDEARAGRIAEAYGEMPHAPGDPKVAGAYKQMSEEMLDQYDALAKRGYNFEFMKRGPDGNVIDPYAKSPALGYTDLRDNKRLQIFPTDSGFGSSALDVSQNPLLAPSGRKFGNDDATLNDVFRAVHDAYGHFGSGNPFFRAPGEERAWVHHSQMFSPEARGALTSETRGQNSFLNYGPNAKHNRAASGADTIYADQKTGVMPEWTHNEGLPDPYRAQFTPSAAPFLEDK